MKSSVNSWQEDGNSFSAPKVLELVIMIPYMTCVKSLLGASPALKLCVDTSVAHRIGMWALEFGISEHYWTLLGLSFLICKNRDNDSLHLKRLVWESNQWIEAKCPEQGLAHNEHCASVSMNRILPDMIFALWSPCLPQVPGSETLLRNPATFLIPVILSPKSQVGALEFVFLANAPVILTVWKTLWW